MKPLFTLILAATLLLAGCARQYTIVLTNGTRMTTKGKPHLDQGTYIFKDAQGQRHMLPAGRVQEIAPSSMATSRVGSGFKAEPIK